MGSKKRTAPIDIPPWQLPAKGALKSAVLNHNIHFRQSWEHQMALDENSMSNESPETDDKEDDEVEVLIYRQPVVNDD